MSSSLDQDEGSKEEEKFVVAIDFGTTYCCVGIWHRDRVEILPNEFGNRKTPCFVSFTDTDVLVGEAAKDELLVNPFSTLFDVRRLIGRRYSDAQVQEGMKNWPFKVTAGPDHKPMMSVKFQGLEKQFTAEDIVAILLKKMVAIATAFLGKPIEKAVVTFEHPDYFQEIRDAAKVAGFEILRLVREPDAVAVGGHNLDNRMVQHFAQQIQLEFQKDILADSEALFLFRSVCEGLKRKLSISSEATANVFWKGFDIKLSITRDKFEEICLDLLHECVVQVETCLGTAKTDKMKVDKVVLVGGSSHIPKVRTLLQEFFCGKELCDVINPDEVVAYGVARQGARFKGYARIRGDGSLASPVYLYCGPDLIPLDLGLETADGAMAVVISRNTYINPASRTEVFSTSTDYQKSVVLQIYEGQSIRAKDNHFIGTLELPRIVQSPKGFSSGRNEVTFSVDEDGLLTIVAEEKEAGVRKELTFPDFTWSNSIMSGKLNWYQQGKLIEEGAEHRKGLTEYSEAYSDIVRTPSNKLLRG